MEYHKYVIMTAMKIRKKSGIELVKIMQELNEMKK
jgi:hypothetical protein